MDKADLLKILEEYRLKNEISQRKLAEILGVDYSTINEWLNGKRYPNAIRTYGIQKFLKQKGVKV
jgi:transcriptional regulator with XRE-family HTH domain